MTLRNLTIFGCSSQQPTRYRNQGGYLLRWAGEGFLIDPGEGTQRQFILAGVAPTAINRILISHFHGDHCMGLPSIFVCLNIHKVRHPIHCYFPASGKRFFDRLRFGTIYHDTLQIIEHPIKEEGVVHDDGQFKIEAAFLDHGVDNIGWRITEADQRKFNPEQLNQLGVKGPLVTQLQNQGELLVDGKRITLDQVSWIRKGDSVAVVIDTRMCSNALKLARNAQLLLCEATYLEQERDLAYNHYHLTAKGAGALAKEANAQMLVLTHYSARYLDLRPFLTEAKELFPNTYLAEDLKVFPIPRSH